MPDWFAVIILGIIEGITEFLPVSSTGHLLLVENTHLLPQQSDLFNTVIQSGAVLAVFLVFSGRIKDLLLNLGDADTRDYLFKLIVAFVITGAGGVIVKALGLTLPKNVAPIAWATLWGGVLILIIEWSFGESAEREHPTWTIAIAVGIFQLLAGIFPGTSRAAATILIAIALGLSRPAATEFSFLLGIPTLFAAGGLEIYKEMKVPGPLPTNQLPTKWSMVALGTIVSAVVAFLVVRWILRFVQHHTFVVFGWYRLALGLFMLFLAYR